MKAAQLTALKEINMSPTLMLSGIRELPSPSTINTPNAAEKRPINPVLAIFSFKNIQPNRAMITGVVDTIQADVAA